jgi:hypothetical protein
MIKERLQRLSDGPSAGSACGARKLALSLEESELHGTRWERKCLARIASSTAPSLSEMVVSLQCCRVDVLDKP